MKRFFLVGIAALLMLLAGSTAYAVEPPKERGLLVTPIRTYAKVQAGVPTNGTFTVVNSTREAVDVTLSVEQFSVADYTYDYKFSPVKEDWIKLQTPRLQLQPNKSQEVKYTMAAPKNAAPGGHYFTLFASMPLKDGAVGSKVRAATVLYVTVDGKLRQTGEIQKETLPWVSFGGDIDFTFDLKNTGNTHFFIYTLGMLSGWTAKPETKEATHIVLPGAIRTIGGVLPAPLLPGIYKATYGYKTDDGHEESRTKYIAYLPLWSLVIPVAGGWIGWLIMKRYKRGQTK